MASAHLGIARFRQVAAIMEPHLAAWSRFGADLRALVRTRAAWCAPPLQSRAAKKSSDRPLSAGFALPTLLRSHPCNAWGRTD